MKRVISARITTSGTIHNESRIGKVYRITFDDSWRYTKYTT